MVGHHRALVVVGAIAVCAVLAGCGPSQEHVWRERAAEARELAAAALSFDAQVELIDQAFGDGRPLTWAEVDSLWPAYEACLLEQDIAMEDLDFSADYPGIRVRREHVTYVPLSGAISGEEIKSEAKRS